MKASDLLPFFFVAEFQEHKSTRLPSCQWCADSIDRGRWASLRGSWNGRTTERPIKIDGKPPSIKKQLENWTYFFRGWKKTDQNREMVPYFILGHLKEGVITFITLNCYVGGSSCLNLFEWFWEDNMFCWCCFLPFGVDFRMAETRRQNFWPGVFFSRTRWAQSPVLNAVVVIPL